jgi:hypothetical protein
VVAAPALGVRLMKRAFMISALLGLLSSLAAATDQPASGEETIRRRARPELREKTGQCLRQLLSCPVRVFGTMRFQFFIDRQGGAFGFTLDSPAFARTGMFSCMKHALLSLLRPVAPGEPAFRVEVKLQLAQERPEGFELEIDAADVQKPSVSPLEGSFSPAAGGWLASCPLADGSRLQLFLSSGRPAATRPGNAPADDLLPCSNGAPAAGNNHKTSGADDCACAASHLAAAAAERLAAARWLLEKGCLKEYRRVLKLLRCEYGLLPETECQLQPGSPRLRRSLAGAVLNKFGWLPDGVLEKLVWEAEPDQRLSVLKEFLLPHPRLFAPVADFFLGQSDQALVALAAGLSCTLGLSGGRAAAKRLLADPRPGARLLALLHASSCLRGRLEEKLTELKNEPLLFLLASRELAALPEAYLPLISRALEHPCPVVRFLAGGELARAGVPGSVLDSTILDRERDPILRKRLRALADGRPPENWPLVQIWLEPGGVE